MFISNTLQEFVTMAQILTQQISLLYSSLFQQKNTVSEVKDFGNLIAPLTKDQSYILEIEKLIRSCCTANKSLSSRQLKWELLKHEAQKFTFTDTKHIAKEKSHQRTN